MSLVAKDEGFVYFQVAFVRGLIIVGAMDSTGFGSNSYQVSPKRYLDGRKELQFVWIPDFLNIVYEFVEKGKRIHFL